MSPFRGRFMTFGISIGLFARFKEGMIAYKNRLLVQRRRGECSFLPYYIQILSYDRTYILEFCLAICAARTSKGCSFDCFFD